MNNVINSTQYSNLMLVYIIKYLEESKDEGAEVLK